LIGRIAQRKDAKMKKSRFRSSIKDRMVYVGFFLFGVSIVALGINRVFAAIHALIASLAAFFLGGLLRTLRKK